MNRASSEGRKTLSENFKVVANINFPTRSRLDHNDQELWDAMTDWNDAVESWWIDLCTYYSDAARTLPPTEWLALTTRQSALLGTMNKAARHVNPFLADRCKLRPLELFKD